MCPLGSRTFIASPHLTRAQWAFGRCFKRLSESSRIPSSAKLERSPLRKRLRAVAEGCRSRLAKGFLCQRRSQKHRQPWLACFQKSGAFIQTSNTGALVRRTPMKRTLQFLETAKSWPLEEMRQSQLVKLDWDQSRLFKGKLKPSSMSSLIRNLLNATVNRRLHIKVRNRDHKAVEKLQKALVETLGPLVDPGACRPKLIRQPLSTAPTPWRGSAL